MVQFPSRSRGYLARGAQLRAAQSAAAAQTLSVIGQRLIDAANHSIGPVSMETRSGAEAGECVCVYVCVSVCARDAAECISHCEMH